MSAFPVKALAGAIVVGAAILCVRCAVRPHRPPLDLDLHSQVGRTLAVETVRRVGPGGSVVIVKPEAPFDMPLVACQLRAFKKELGGQVTVDAEETIRLDLMGPLDGLLTPAIYFDLAQKYASAKALVSFVGLGEFREEDLARLGSGRPPIFVVSPNVRVPKKLLARHLVGLAIVPHTNRVVMAVAPEQDAFSRVYEVVVPDDASRR